MTTLRPFISLLTLLSLFSWTSGHAKGDSGTYFVHGKAYGPSNSVLKNVELRIVTADTIKTIKTDSEGNFEFEVKWETVCATNDSKMTTEELNNEWNKDIRIWYNDQEIILKNEWRKFARVSDRTKDNMTMGKGLVFKKE